MAIAAQCQNCILMLEHEIFHEALTEWAGYNKENAMGDIQYLAGVNDFVDLSIRRVLEEADEESTTED